MSVDLKPWDAGYIPPAPVKQPTMAERGAKGGQTAAARKKAGLPPLPKGDGTGKQGRKRTNPEKQARLDAITEETLPLKKKVFLDRFIYEYLHDFNSSMAYIRAGGTPNHSTTGGPECLRTGYVQTQLRILSTQLEQNQIITRNDVLLGIKKEANHFGEDGSSAARVRAWGMLAKVLGMDQPEPPKDPNADLPKGGVMEVPMVESMDQWSDAASSSQLQLKNDVRK